MMTTKPKKSLRGAFPVVHGNLFAPDAINGAIAPIVVGNLTTPCLVVRKTSTPPSLSSEALSLYSIVIPSLRQCVHRIVTWAFLVESALYMPQIFSGFPSVTVGLWYLSIYRAQFNIYIYIYRVS